MMGLEKEALQYPDSSGKPAGGEATEDLERIAGIGPKIYLISDEKMLPV
jgi:predicted flap endonuclease-1-like 5' DNA nuclease